MNIPSFVCKNPKIICSVILPISNTVYEYFTHLTPERTCELKFKAIYHFAEVLQMSFPAISVTSFLKYLKPHFRHEDQFSDNIFSRGPDFTCHISILKLPENLKLR